MERTKSFTGRARRLTNRWSVKASDLLARALITIGGIGTIVAVLMVLVFLLYVSVPLFLPTTIERPELTERAEGEQPLLLQLDEHNILAWQLFADSRFALRRLDSKAVVHEQTLLEGRRIHSAASYPEGPEFAAGLDNGSVVLGAFTPKTAFYRREELPPEIAELEIGELADYESGVLERTPQGMYRWESVEVTVGEPLELADAAIEQVDFLKDGSTTHIAAVTATGEVIVGKVEETTNILGDTSYEACHAKVDLPPGRSGKPWKAFVTGLGNGLLVLWRDGHLARYTLPSNKSAQLVEEKSLTDHVEVTAATMLQGRYTLVVGDAEGDLNAWFTATTLIGGNERRVLFKAHELAALDGAVTSLGRSRLVRLLAAGSATGQLNLYFVTGDRELLSTHACDGPIDAITLAPDDDQVLALSGSKQWRAELDLRHPEASFTTLFRPVWYEDYSQPLDKWQSTTGGLESEPKFGLMPLVFGTAKATFYSLLFGVPIALLAAIYSSEFVDPQVKGPIKSLIEMMASVPSVVLGFLAGLVFAPFVDDVLPTLLSGLLLIPFSFLLGAQLWQQLPQKTALQLAKYRLLAIGLMLTVGAMLSGRMGPYLQSWLFGGNFKSWLNGSGPSSGGWFLLLLPLTAVLISVSINTYLNPWLRQRFAALSRQRFAALNLTKFLLVSALTVAVAYLAAWLIAKAGFDPRGGLLDTYVQRNALVVGFVMGFAIIPIIYTISEDALSTVPHHLRSASLACGATPWQTTWRVVVPTAASGLFSAVMVGMGRAVGETMIMLMATGNVPLMEWNIFNGFRTLSANIAEELGEASPWSTHFRILFLTGVILLLLTLIINTAAEAIRMQFRKRASQL
jgi:phosphate transport system permease protein